MSKIDNYTRTRNYIEKSIGTSLRSFAGSVNNSALKSNILYVINKQLNDFVNMGVIHDFIIKDIFIEESHINISFDFTPQSGVPLSQENKITHQFTEYFPSHCTSCGLIVISINNGIWFAEDDLSCDEKKIKDIIE